MRSALVIVAVLGGVARADDYDTPSHVGFSLQGVIGWGNNGFAYGGRPELLYAPTRDFSFGLYAEVGGDRDTYAGGGVTIAAYGRPLAAALSAGIDTVNRDDAWQRQYVISGFFGFRTLEVLPGAPFDMPVGFRLDVRPASGPLPTTAVFSLSIDVIAVALLAPLR